MSNYRAAYFSAAAGDQQPLADQNGHGHEHEHEHNHEHEHQKGDQRGDGITDPAEFVRNMLVKQACCGASAVRPLYCQLDVLDTVIESDGLSKTKVWRERFRWVKFEEELWLACNRWSSPYVPILSPFSVMEARKQLESGLTLLMKVAPTPDPEVLGVAGTEAEPDGRDLKGVAEDIEALLHAPPFELDSHVAEEVKQLLLAQRLNFVQPKRNAQEAKVVEPEKSDHKTNKRYRKKVHRNAEGCSVMVGTLPMLRSVVSVFIRLDQPVLEPLLEIDLPVRFICLLLGPRESGLADLTLVGRAVATLMTDEIFHKIVYLADEKSELIAGVDEFLKCSTILPPLGYSLNDRIPPPENIPNTDHRHADDKKEQEVSHVPEGLERTGRLFGGLIQDVKRRAPWYKSDFLDAIHPQTIGAIFFIYFACITPIITFGGMLSDATGGYLGAMESILSGLVCGVAYALFAGQPLTIMGSTGPVLVFESIVFRLCDRYHWDYLSFRWWIGMWTALFLVIAVALDLSFLVKYITRFTEENFALLIALIFIVEAFTKMAKIAEDYPVNRVWHPKHEVVLDCSCLPNPNVSLIEVSPKMAKMLPTYTLGNMTLANFSAMDYYSWDRDLFTPACTEYGGHWVGTGCGLFNVPDVFFFSVLIFLGSFFISITLKKARASSMFPSIVRRLLSDFAVMIAICLCTLTDYLLDLHTPKLLIPTKFEPTLGFKYRVWLIHPFGINPWWSSILAIGPAILAVILLFLDQQITAVIVNRRENKMVKGCGYHLDLLVVAVCVAINTAFGLPWFVAATVLSINHVLALRRESECTAPGEKPQMLGCRENRVTGLVVFIAIGMSSFMSPMLTHIPMPVLYGVFLFMGVSSLDGLQLWHRFLLLLQPRKTQPDLKFLREVKLSRVHLFTFIQLSLFTLLWVVKKVSVISIAFPLMVLSLCFARKVLDFIFTKKELRLLDDLLPGQMVEETTIRLKRLSTQHVSTAREELEDMVSSRNGKGDKNV